MVFPGAWHVLLHQQAGLPRHHLAETAVDPREIRHQIIQHEQGARRRHAAHGITGCHDVALAVLEVDGSISCLKYDEIKPDASTHLARRKGIQKKS